jgi:hypothetical protein
MRACFRSSARCSNRQRTSCQPATGSSSIARIVSPDCSPACAATVPASGAAMIGFASCTPDMNRTQYSAIAKRKLATGPATTIANRFHTD